MSDIIDLTSSPVRNQSYIEPEYDLDSDLPLPLSVTVTRARTSCVLLASDPVDWLPDANDTKRARAADDDCFNLDDFGPATKRQRFATADDGCFNLDDFPSPPPPPPSRPPRSRVSIDDPILCTSPPALAPVPAPPRVAADCIMTSSQPGAQDAAPDADEIVRLRQRSVAGGSSARHTMQAQSAARMFLLSTSVPRTEEIVPKSVRSAARFSAATPTSDAAALVFAYAHATHRAYEHARPSRSIMRSDHTNKKIATREMLTLLPADLDGAVAAAAAQHLQTVKAEHRVWQSPVRGVVCWKRTTAWAWDAAAQDWHAAPPRTVSEQVALVVLSMADVEAHIAAPGGLAAHIGLARRHFKGYELVYLVQGLAEWQRQRRQRTERNRTAVTGGAPVTDVSGDQVDAEAVEEALLEAQVVHGVYVQHTGSAVETGQWVAVFTQHVATAPYRRARDAVRDAAASFCVDAGQVPTWEEAAAAYAHMFAQVARLPRQAGAVVTRRAGAGAARLVRVLEEEGAEALSGKGAEGEGLGVAASKKLWRLFMERDEEAMV